MTDAQSATSTLASYTPTPRIRSGSSIKRPNRKRSSKPRGAIDLTNRGGNSANAAGRCLIWVHWFRLGVLSMWGRPCAWQQGAAGAGGCRGTQVVRGCPALAVKLGRDRALTTDENPASRVVSGLGLDRR